MDRLPEIEMIGINEIFKNDDNPRLIRDKKFKKLVESIKQFPEMLYIRPIVVDSNNTIIGGNMRYEACLDLKWIDIPIIRADNLTEDQKNEFIIKDNLQSGEWNFDKLANEWDKELLNIYGIEIPSLLGADLEEDNNNINTIDTYDKDQIDYNIKENDLIEIDKHRLLCGDCTIENNYNILMNNNIPFVMVTDPPYGVNYDPIWRYKAKIIKNNQKLALGIIHNDNNANWNNAIKLFNGSVIYIWHSSLKSNIVAQSLIDNGYDIKSQIIWNKDTFTLSRSHYNWKHEPCYYAIKKNNNPKWKGGNSQSTIWDINKLTNAFNNVDDGKTFHSSQKPIECMARPIINHGDKDDIVYDPFLGSGTTMIAADKNNRICYGMEIDPKYCNMIINRMHKYNNKLLIKINNVEWKN